MSDQSIQKIILENERLKRSKILLHCRGCSRLTVHPCGAFMWCPIMGAVNPDADFCSRRMT